MLRSSPGGRGFLDFSLFSSSPKFRTSSVRGKNLKFSASLYANFTCDAQLPRSLVSSFKSRFKRAPKTTAPRGRPQDARSHAVFEERLQSLSIPPPCPVRSSRHRLVERGASTPERDVKLLRVPHHREDSAHQSRRCLKSSQGAGPG